MFKIAICDDERLLRKDLRKTLERELELSGITYLIEEFQCGEELVREFSPHEFDLIFLDIEMRELNGIETAKLLRKRGEDAVIIFVTSHPDFVFHGYEVQAFHYILKPYEDDKIVTTLRNVLKKLEYNTEQYYLMEQKSGSIKLPLGKTKYFVSDRRTIQAVTDSETYSFYGKLNDLELEIPDCFIRIHNRYLVNLKYITSIEGNVAECEGEKLPISRSCKQELHIAFTRYILGS